MFIRKLPVMLALALIGGALIAPQAQAQRWHDGWNNYGWHDYRGGWNNNNINREQQRLLNQMSRGLNTGRLTRGEYDMLMARYNQINTLETQLRYGGLNPRERWRLNNQLQYFSNSLQREMRDREMAGRYNPWY